MPVLAIYVEMGDRGHSARSPFGNFGKWRLGRNAGYPRNGIDTGNRERIHRPTPLSVPDRLGLGNSICANAAVGSAGLGATTTVHRRGL